MGTQTFSDFIPSAVAFSERKFFLKLPRVLWILLLTSDLNDKKDLLPGWIMKRNWKSNACYTSLLIPYRKQTPIFMQMQVREFKTIGSYQAKLPCWLFLSGRPVLGEIQH